MIQEQIKKRFDTIYGADNYDVSLIAEIVEEINQIKKLRKGDHIKWSEKDIILITYGDSIVEGVNRPLKTLESFLLEYLNHAISHVHILPFFPYSSDDGFSVIDYRKVNPELGSWEDVESIGKKYRLMADLVINHVSQYSTWFQNYLKGLEPEDGYFIETDPSADLSKVVRPRSLPLLTPVETAKGEKHVWTTFSADQIDLNFANPLLLTEMLKIFLFYFSRGIQIIRLDAIAFLWKEPGTSCLHLPQTHEVVKLMRDIVDYLDPGIILITETNVPNKENLSYFGQGDEAHMVYQFSLPPLLLHALHTSDSTYLTRWANSLSDIPADCTFFNFTASHDGIGVRPLEGLLPAHDIKELAEAMKEYGGRISTRRNSDGSDSPYEMNITYLDALKYTRAGKDDLQTERFICSQTIMMSMKGIPAFYIHSLLGTHNYTEGIEKTGMARTINRRKWKAVELYPLLRNETQHAFILKELVRRMKIRKTIKAFHPDTDQQVIDAGREFFILMRGRNQRMMVIANLTDEKKQFRNSSLANRLEGSIDQLSGKKINSGETELDPYQVMWIL